METIGRGAGRGAVAAAAYRSASRLADERQGVVWDFTKKRGVLHAEIIAHQGQVPGWALDRQRLWNEAEAREDKSTRRADATVARDFRLALPHELDEGGRLGVARECASLLAERYGTVVDLAVHAPNREGDERNFHVHMLMPDRQLGADGFGAKIRQLNLLNGGKGEIEFVREAFACIGADALEAAGHHIEAERYRVGHKTLEEQYAAALLRGDAPWAEHLRDREATVHMGPHATAMERQGQKTDLGDLNREITARNEEREQLRAEGARIEAEIISLDAERARREDAKAQREEAKTLDPERILASLTERRATFSRGDLNFCLKEFLPDAKARSAFVDEVLARGDVIPLREHEHAPVSRYSTRQVVLEEERLAECAERLAHRLRHGQAPCGRRLIFMSTSTPSSARPWPMRPMAKALP